MSETKFEVGGRYSTRGGDTAEIDEIQKLEDGTLRIHAFHRNKKAGASFKLWYSSNGRILQDGLDHPFDLLLPAIEPEGEPAGLSVETRLAVLAYGNFWRHFHKLVSANEWDPCAGCSFSLTHHDRVSIAGTYPTREAALSESTAVIAAIDRLLEGGPHD